MKTSVVGTRTIVKNINLDKIQIRMTCERCDKSELITLEEYGFLIGHLRCEDCEEAGYDSCDMKEYTLIIINDEIA